MAIFALIRITSCSSDHHPPLSHIKNRPPISWTSRMISSATSSFSARFTVVRFCFASMRPRKTTFPGWHNIDVPGRKITSFDFGHSMMDKLLVLMPSDVNPTSTIFRKRNHCFKCVILMFPLSVMGVKSTGMPKLFKIYCSSTPLPVPYNSGETRCVRLRQSNARHEIKIKTIKVYWMDDTLSAHNS